MLTQTSTIGSTCEILSGFAWRSSGFNSDGRGIPIIRIQNVDAVMVADFVYWDQPYDEKFVIRSGDILLTLSGSFRIVSWNGPDALLNQRIIKITPSDQLDRSWLLHVIRGRLLQIEAMGRHALVNNVSVTDIRNMPIPLPPLSEQKRIAEILDRAEALRAKRRAALALLDELTQSIFLDMFGDPVSNPMGWPIQVFKDVCDSRLGKMLDAKKQVGDNPRPYMRNINVQWGKLDLSTVWEMDFNEKDRDEFRLLPDDVLICEGGAGVAQTAVWRGEIAECYFQKSLHRVRPRPCSATPEYIAFLIRMLMRKGSELFRLVSSATIPHLTGVKLKTLRIPVPPVELQCRFGVATESVAQQKVRIEASLSELDQLFASLQHRAFRGELS